MTDYQRIDSEADIDALIDASRERPQIIFKHSTSCSISAMAKSRVDRALTKGDLPYPVHFLDLLRYRGVSNYVATALGVRHASPQLIVVDAGAPGYVATHLDIDPAAIVAAG